MTAILKVDTIQDTAGNNIINESSDTITIGASGDTTNIVGTLQNNGSAVASTNGITMADSWRITANFTSSSGTNDFSSNWERSDQAAIGQIGSAMTESSGIFTFPSTGVYFITAQIYCMYSAAAVQYLGAILNTTTNNSSYTQIAQAYTHIEAVSSQHSHVALNTLFDVTDTSTHKIKFSYEAQNAFLVGGSSGNDRTFMRFIRLGDT